MSEFISIVLAVPTVVFTGMLIISVVFWLISLVFGSDGGADIEIDAGLDLDAGIDADIELNGLSGFLVALDLHLMPLSLVFTVVSLVGWLTSFTFVYFFTVGLLLSIPVGLACLAFGILSAGRVARLAAPLFTVTPAIKQQALLGRHCVIKTQRVDDTFGQAEVIDADMSSHLIQVRCADGNSFSAGSSALLVDLNDGLFTVVEGLTDT